MWACRTSINPPWPTSLASTTVIKVLNKWLEVWAQWS